MSRKQFFTLDQIAARWGCCHNTVLKHVYDGALRAIDISTNPNRRSRYVISSESLEEFEAARTVKSAAVPKPRRRRVKVPPSEITEFIR